MIQNGFQSAAHGRYWSWYSSLRLILRSLRNCRISLEGVFRSPPLSFSSLCQVQSPCVSKSWFEKPFPWRRVSPPWYFHWIWRGNQHQLTWFNSKYRFSYLSRKATPQNILMNHFKWLISNNFRKYSGLETSIRSLFSQAFESKILRTSCLYQQRKLLMYRSIHRHNIYTCVIIWIVCLVVMWSCHVFIVLLVLKH